MSHSLGAKLSELRHKGYITDIEYQKLKKALEQQLTITSTEDNAEMVYPQVDGITPIVVNEDIYECSCGYGWDKNKTSRFHFCPNCGKAVGDGNDYKYIKSISNPTGIEFDIDIDKKVESYGKLLKHPVIKHIMGMDETQEQIDFVQPHKRIPVTLAVGSGDLISRQAVMDYIHRILNQGTGKKKSLEFIQKYVTNMPSVKPQEKTGHWIDTGSGQECSECHEIQYGYDNHRFYCGNCGARMD